MLIVSPATLHPRPRGDKPDRGHGPDNSARGMLYPRKSQNDKMTRASNRLSTLVTGRPQNDLLRGMKKVRVRVGEKEANTLVTYENVISRR